MNQNLYALLQSRFPNDPEAIWIQTADGEQLRYGDIDEATARYAGALAAQGVVAGERVLVQVDKSAQTLILYLAALRLGAIFVPLYPLVMRTLATMLNGPESAQNSAVADSES